MIELLLLLALVLLVTGLLVAASNSAVDEARFYLMQDLLYSQRVKRMGLVDGVQTAPAGDRWLLRIRGAVLLAS